jgi:hypothetical protein
MDRFVCFLFFFFFFFFFFKFFFFLKFFFFYFFFFFFFFFYKSLLVYKMCLILNENIDFYALHRPTFKYAGAQGTFH